MSELRLLIFLILGVFILTSCDTKTTENEGINFADPNLEQAIRYALNIHTGPITEQDVLSIVTFEASEESISDLTGMEFLTNLKYLNLSRNNISDITPLAGLTKPEEIDLSSKSERDAVYSQFNKAGVNLQDMNEGNVMKICYYEKDYFCIVDSDSVQKISISGERTNLQ